MPEFLTEAWFEALAAALESLPATASSHEGAGLALGQIVTGAPEGSAVTAGQDGEVRYTIVLRDDGTASLVRGTTAGADVVLVEDFPTAAAVASGTSSVSDMLSAGKIKLSGDVRALLAAGDMLAAIAPAVRGALGGGEPI